MHPSLRELLNLEQTTLQTIGNMGHFSEFQDIYVKAGRHRSIINANSSSLDFHTSFAMNIRLRADKRNSQANRSLAVGAFIEGDRVQDKILRTSYSFVLSRYDRTDGPIIRKFHFDYEAAETRNVSEPKPSIHTQICGKLSGHQKALGYKEERLSGLYPGFEKPRLPSLPMSLALLLDWIFLEFQSDPNARKIHSDPTWKNLVSQAEHVVLKPYFLAGAEYFNSTANVGKPFIKSKLYE